MASDKDQRIAVPTGRLGLPDVVLAGAADGSREDHAERCGRDKGREEGELSRHVSISFPGIDVVHD